MTISLCFDTFATYFIAQEVASAADFPNAFQQTVEAWTEPDFGPDDSGFWESMADSLIGDSRDDLINNFENFILLTDRAQEMIDADRDDPNALDELEGQLYTWLDDQRLEDGLAKAYKLQWEFYNAVMKSVAERDARVAAGLQEPPHQF